MPRVSALVPLHNKSLTWLEITKEKFITKPATIQKSFKVRKNTDKLRTLSQFSRALTYNLVIEKFLGDHRFFVEPACAATLVSCYLKEYLKDIPIGDGPLVLEICGGSAVSVQMLETWKKTAFS